MFEFEFKRFEINKKEVWGSKNGMSRAKRGPSAGRAA